MHIPYLLDIQDDSLVEHLSCSGDRNKHDTLQLFYIRHLNHMGSDCKDQFEEVLWDFSQQLSTLSSDCQYILLGSYKLDSGLLLYTLHFAHMILHMGQHTFDSDMTAITRIRDQLHILDDKREVLLSLMADMSKLLFH
jgi:hypothetical protein